MNVKLIQAQDEIVLVEIARVSSSRPKEQRRENPDGLIRYLIKNKHWSPFEHTYMTLEIETSLAIATQLLRHRSFTFQQFSMRYAEAEGFEPIELRKQAEKNRQSSTEPGEFIIRAKESAAGWARASRYIEEHLEKTFDIYQELIEAGVAREQARFILPTGTRTRLYMTGNIRSWVHMIMLRDDEHAQKEVQKIAQVCRNIFIRWEEH